MINNLSRSSRTIFTSMIVTTLGVVLTTTLSEPLRPIGIVFIAIGGLLFIVGLRQRKLDNNGPERSG